MTSELTRDSPRGPNDLSGGSSSVVIPDSVAAPSCADSITGISAPLTATAALDLGEIATILSRLTGRSITRVRIDDDDWKTAAIARGLPPMVADFSLGMFQAARRGEFDVVDPTLEAILGRPPLSVEHTLQQLLGQV